MASEVFVEAVHYQPVTIDLSITANPPDIQALRDDLIQALRAYFDPLVGGDEGGGWPFGDPVRPSSLLRVTQKVVADAGTVNSVEITLDDSPEGLGLRGCVDRGRRSRRAQADQGVTVNRTTAGRGGLR